MLRVSLSVLFAVLVALVAAFAVSSYQGPIRDALDAQAQDSLRRAATIATLERRVAEQALIARAEFVAGGADVFEAITADYAEEQDPGYERHIKVYERLLRYENEFINYDRETGAKLDNADLPLRWQRPVRNELIFAVDGQGKGLAALGKDMLKWHGDDVSAVYPLISEVLQKNEPRAAVWRFSYDPRIKESERGLYLVALAPIRTRNQEQPVGVVIIGNPINDGVARAHQQLIAGAPGERVPADEIVTFQKRAPQLAYFHGDRVFGATIDGEAQRALAAQLVDQKVLDQPQRDKRAEFTLNDSKYTARVRLLLGHQGEQVPSGVIVFTALDPIFQPLRGPTLNTLLLAALAALLGALAVLVLVQIFLKPLADIEHGVQEILAGKKDYEFPVRGHKISQGLAHQLNLMSAYLQGKRMPDDDDKGGGWDEMGGAGAAKPGAVKAGGVDMASLMGARPGDKKE